MHKKQDWYLYLHWDVLDNIVLQEVQEQIAKEQYNSYFSRVITCFRFSLAGPDSSLALSQGYMQAQYFLSFYTHWYQKIKYNLYSMCEAEISPTIWTKGDFPAEDSKASAIFTLRQHGMDLQSQRLHEGLAKATRLT